MNDTYPRTSGSGPRRLVVVGHGMAGHRLVEALTARDTDGGWHVTVLGEEPRPAYDRVALSSCFDGADEEALRLPAHDAARVDVRTGDPVTVLDTARRAVVTASGSRLGYDALVLATGSRPFVPPLPGSDAPGCYVYRTLEDIDAIRAAAEGSATGCGVVVGGGLLGLEAANALRLLGLATQVVETAPHLMAVQLDEGGGALLGRMVEELGVAVRTGTATERVVTDPATGAVCGVELSDGTRVETDVVVFAAGVRPRDELARRAGLAVGERGGVVVDEACRSVTDPHVWAVGEVACVDGRTLGLVAPGYAMAETVADRLLGGGATFPGADTATRLKLLGVGVASFGDAHATTPGALEVVLNDPVAATYGKLVVSDDARTLLGGILVGDTSAYPLLRPLVGSALPADPATLLAPESAAGGGPAGAGIAALPDDAQICSCHAVTKGALTEAVTGQGCADVAALKTRTKAGTGCGSCVPALGRLLEAAGVEQSKALCEHFDHSRAELYEIVAARGITTFSRLIAEHGRGRGCDVCKPAVAAILASRDSGTHILDGERGGLQDTNDRHLANMQRNGTYSVVPRIPGGEITPDRLIVLGEVARDFGLYTKITGGQRIDLLGARLEQLPAVWKRLTDAGFESGHAYGKAVRTVKSCVGSTWCRYGVQDSVGLAVELELRYRGLRAPHKLKAGVSGCARECAEARSKDFGIIATEAGWNLYVGGNGGFTPRHAQLLASDLDHDTLVRTIDRFLMFYIRTADRLQRTAAWLEDLEGGLDHLRAVVLDDRLGICAELDAAMERHVADYRDEWRGVLEDPEKLARFTSFVNAPGTPDPAISFAVEREQPVPVLLPVPTPPAKER
ncbi:nitrite reductase large subunit [Streptomyces albus subsp. chlorinus]|uniref:nitrite reductase large subunit NirB n=1 Tax=Streptomyces albus TaxID=1888 RepID=UPI00156E5275|nr:nitrite reductase large subunit NirB [Streptomyces albus]NSC21260.1 nitrite reductase large subunit [Streptomyces albus subsp. chlorinus]